MPDARSLRVLWTHNFDPDALNSGVFMHTTARGLRARGVDLHLEYLGNLRSFRQLRHARAQVRRLAGDFDVVHAQYGSACAYATAAAGQVPKLVSIRGSDWQTLHSSFGFHYVHTRIANLLTTLALARFDLVLPVSRRIASSLPGKKLIDEPVVLPSPVDLSRFVPRDRRAAKRELGCDDPDQRWVLFNSRNLDSPVKRFALARRAVELAQLKQPNLRLRTASDIPHEQMPLFVAACDVIVCTSENEGWPNSVKEALACNVPFVATDVSDLRDIAAREPSCHVCAADAEQLADSLVAVLADELPATLRAHVKDMSLEVVSETLLNLYRSLTGDSSTTTESPS